MKTISPARFNVIVDNIYHNCQRNVLDRKSIAQLGKDSGVSASMVQKVRQLLIDHKLVIVEGRCRTQIAIWHHDKAQPNPVMLARLYEEFTHFDSRVKVKAQKPGRVSLESALRALVSLGYTGVISKSKKMGYTIVTESIDLSKVEVGE